MTKCCITFKPSRPDLCKVCPSVQISLKYCFHLTSLLPHYRICKCSLPWSFLHFQLILGKHLLHISIPFILTRFQTFASAFPSTFVFVDLYPAQCYFSKWVEVMQLAMFSSSSLVKVRLTKSHGSDFLINLLFAFIEIGIITKAGWNSTLSSPPQLLSLRCLDIVISIATNAL